MYTKVSEIVHALKLKWLDKHLWTTAWKTNLTKCDLLFIQLLDWAWIHNLWASFPPSGKKNKIMIKITLQLNTRWQEVISHFSISFSPDTCSWLICIDLEQNSFFFALSQKGVTLAAFLSSVSQNESDHKAREGPWHRTFLCRGFEEEGSFKPHMELPSWSFC